jgi:L-2-hydroxyglutarate oxidase LhgO
MLALQGDLENAGGMVACHTEVVRLVANTDGVLVETADGTRLQAKTVVNAAGLRAVAIAQRTEGLAQEHIPVAYFAKGNYFTLSGRSPFDRLIYPAPDPQAHLAGLGIHLTVDLGGQAKFGPDVQWVDGPDDFQADASRAGEFEVAVRSYWPGLPAGSLQPGYAGIRPKISGPNEPAADFRIDGPAVHGVPGLVNMFGIESPGLTSSLALGDCVANLISA